MQSTLNALLSELIISLNLDGKRITKSREGVCDTNDPILGKLPRQQGGEEGHQEGLSGHRDTRICSKGSRPTLAFLRNVAVSRSQVAALTRVTDVQKTVTTEDSATSYHSAVEGHSPLTVTK